MLSDLPNFGIWCNGFLRLNLFYFERNQKTLIKFFARKPPYASPPITPTASLSTVPFGFNGRIGYLFKSYMPFSLVFNPSENEPNLTFANFEGYDTDGDVSSAILNSNDF